jgi:putative hemolysin
MDSGTLMNVGLVLAFVIVGGVFAATEIALVSLRESQLATIEHQSARGARVAAVARDPNRFLAAVQIGVTVAGFFSAAYGGATLAPDFAVVLEHAGVADVFAESVALVGLTLVIAFLSLVLGELVPKRLALQKALVVSLAVAPVLDRFATVMRPVIWLLSASTNAVVRLLGGDPTAAGERLSEDELRGLVSTHEDLDEHERRILSDVFAASETTVKEVMRPRGDVTFMSAATQLTEAARQVRDLPYSRYPITDRGFDDVIGFLHVRDLLGVRPDDVRTVADVSRPVLMLPSSRLILPTVATMRMEGVHLAVLVDEYGGTDGIVTLEDLVEELVGEIRDEYDASEPLPADDLSELDAGMSLEDFEEATGIRLENGGYETIAGFVIARLGHIPVAGEEVEIEEGSFEVVAASGTRVVRLAFHRPAGGPVEAGPHP